MRRGRRLLLPLVPVYAAGLHIAGWLRARGGEPRVLGGVVISVGSLSAGGAGKTPVVLALAKLLGGSGYAVRILTRGYKRTGRGVERVDPEGDAVRFGDEPLLLARRSGVPVYVGRDRYRAGLLAEAGAADGTVVHLLDDGFQHRRLARDLDVVLLTSKDVDDGLLPAGDLREPLQAIRRAGVIAVREDEARSVLPRLPEIFGGAAMPPVWVVRRTLSLLPGGPRRPLVFCGIARPEGFTEMLRSAGVAAAGVVRFADHHRYVVGDIDRLLEEARRTGADGFVATEKDGVKLTAAMRGRLESVGPLLAPELVVTFVDERAVLEQLLGTIAHSRRERQP